MVLEDAARSVVCLAHVDSARNAGSLMKMVADVLDGADPADPETGALRTCLVPWNESKASRGQLGGQRRKQK